MTTPYQRAIWQYRRDELDSAVMDAIRQYIAENECSPSVRDIAATTGRSVGSVHKSLCRLEQQGAIKRKPGKACSVRIVGGA